MLVTKNAKETVEVTFPFFSMYDGKAYKEYYAIYENLSISILVGSLLVNVSAVNDNSKINQAIDNEPITELDFDFAYQMALDRLTKAVNPQKESV